MGVAGLAAGALVVGVVVWHRGHDGTDGHDAHEHHAPPGAAAGLFLDEGGRRWVTDEPLRKGMAAIRAIVATVEGGVDDAGAARAADAVRGQVNELIANCKLEPKADAVLHVLIARLLGGAQALTVPATRPEGLAMLHEALADYPRYFEHPGWSESPK